MVLYVTDKVSSTGEKTSLFPSNWGNFFINLPAEKSNTKKAFCNTDLSKFVTVQPSNVSMFSADYSSVEYSPFVRLTFDVYIPEEKSAWFAGIIADCQRHKSTDSYSKGMWGFGHTRTDKGAMDIYHAVSEIGDTSFKAGRFSENEHEFEYEYGFNALEDYIGLHEYQMLFCWAGWYSAGNRDPDYYLVVDNNIVGTEYAHVNISTPYGIHFWSSDSNQEPVLFSNVIAEWGYAVRASVDLQREVQRYNVETKTTVDLQRDIIVTQKVNVDLQRDVRTNITTTFDLQRDVRTKNTVNVDLQRDIIATEQVRVNLQRDVEEFNNQLCAGRPKRFKLYINVGTESSPVWQPIYVLKDTSNTDIVFAREQWRY